MKPADAVPIDSDETVPMEKTVAGTEEDPILLEKVETKQKPGPIEAQLTLNNELLQQVANAEILLRMRIEEPNEHAIVQQMVNGLQNATTRLIRWTFETYGRCTNNEQQIIEMSVQFVAPTGWIGLVAYERLWQRASQIEDPAKRCAELERIIHWLINILATNKDDEPNFGKKLHPLNDRHNEILHSLRNTWQEDISDSERIVQFQNIWNDCITILTSEPKTEAEPSA